MGPERERVTLTDAEQFVLLVLETQLEGGPGRRPIGGGRSLRGAATAAGVAAALAVGVLLIVLAFLGQ